MQIKSIPLVIVAALVVLATAAAAPRAAGVKVPPHERFRLPNGVTVLLLPKRDVPLIAYTAMLRGGARVDPAGKEGLASLTAALLEKGAGSRNAFQFADAVAGAGGSFSTAAGAESLTVGGQFLARDRALMLELLGDALLRPRLPLDEFEKLRNREIETIKAIKDSEPQSLLSAYGRAFLFADHVYAKPQSGSELSLAAIKADDVRQFYSAQFGADRLTLVFAGDIDAKWLRTAVGKAFGKMPKATAALPVVAPTERASGRKVLLIDSPGSVQSYFWLANTGVARNFPQRAALDITNTLYGGRFTSILYTELRVKTGLSYSASSGFTRGTAAGEFAIRSLTQTETTEQAIDLTLLTLQRLHQDGISAELLESARNYLTGQYPTQLETAASWAGVLADLELYGLGPEYIESYGPSLAAVSLSDAIKVIAAAFPQPDNLRLVIIGDAKRIRGVVAKYGAVSELKLSSPGLSR